VEMRINLTKTIMESPTVMVAEVAEVEEIRETAVAATRLSANSSSVVFLTPPKVGTTSYLICMLIPLYSNIKQNLKLSCPAIIQEYIFNTYKKLAA
jgi:hypothetical protein